MDPKLLIAAFLKRGGKITVCPPALAKGFTPRHPVPERFAPRVLL